MWPSSLCRAVTMKSLQTPAPVMATFKPQSFKSLYPVQLHVMELVGKVRVFIWVRLESAKSAANEWETGEIKVKAMSSSAGERSGSCTSTTRFGSGFSFRFTAVKRWATDSGSVICQSTNDCMCMFNLSCDRTHDLLSSSVKHKIIFKKVSFCSPNESQCGPMSIQLHGQKNSKNAFCIMQKRKSRRLLKYLQVTLIMYLSLHYIRIY